MEQGTEQWFAARLGKVTASRVADVMAKTKSGPSASRKNYMMELLCQRLTGRAEDGYTNTAMQRGTELEPIARGLYEAESGVMVEQEGFVCHAAIEWFGASPDGLVGGDGLIEIKCPNTATHIEFMRSRKPDNRYQWQMLAQMACTDRQWCDFVSYDDRLPEHLQLICERFHRDDERITQMEAEIRGFLAELDKLTQELERTAA